MVVPGPEEEAPAFTHRATVAFAMAPSLLLVFRIEGVDCASSWLRESSESLRPTPPGFRRCLPDRANLNAIIPAQLLGE